MTVVFLGIKCSPQITTFDAVKPFCIYVSFLFSHLEGSFFFISYVYSPTASKINKPQISKGRENNR